MTKTTKICEGRGATEKEYERRGIVFNMAYCPI